MFTTALMMNHSMDNLNFNLCKHVRILALAIKQTCTIHIHQNEYLCAANYRTILTYIHIINFTNGKYFDLFSSLYLFDSETSYLIMTNPECQNNVLYMVYYDMICFLRFIIIHVIMHVFTYHIANVHQFIRIMKLYCSNYHRIKGNTICRYNIDENNYARLSLLIYFVFLQVNHFLHVSAFVCCCYHDIYEIPYFVLENLTFINIIIKLIDIAIIIFDYIYLKYRMLCYSLYGIFSASLIVIITNYYKCGSLFFKQLSWSIRNNTKIVSTLENNDSMDPIHVQEKHQYSIPNMGFSFQIVILHVYKQIFICLIHWSMIMNCNIRRQNFSRKYCASGNNNCLYFNRYVLANLFLIHVHIKRDILVKVYCSYICVICMYYCKGHIIARVGEGSFIFWLTFSDIT